MLNALRLSDPRFLSQRIALYRMRRRFDDELRFLDALLRRPRKVGAVLPTGRALATAMAAEVDPALEGSVLELGPGTGVITRALVARGLNARRLWLVEYDEGFAAHLARAFRGATVRQGDARRLAETLGEGAPQRFAAVVSGLPLLNFTESDRQTIFAGAMALLPPGGVFVQFSYGPRAPLPADPALCTLEVSDWVMRNVPPARVFTYRKLRMA